MKLHYRHNVRNAKRDGGRLRVFRNQFGIPGARFVLEMAARNYDGYCTHTISGDGADGTDEYESAARAIGLPCHRQWSLRPRRFR